MDSDIAFVEAVMSQTHVPQFIEECPTSDKRKRQRSVTQEYGESKKMKTKSSEPSMTEIAKQISNLEVSLNNRMGKFRRQTYD